MKHKVKFMIFVFVIYPYIVGFTPEAADSSSTVLKVIVGRGSYANISRDCEGNPISIVDIPFNDAAVEVDHHRGNVRTGIRGGVTHLTDGSARMGGGYWEGSVFSWSTVFYVNPDIGLHWKYFGVNAGLVYFSDYFAFHEEFEIDMKIMPSFSLRVGNQYGTYFSTGFMNNVPLISGGSLFDMGVGFHRQYPVREFWIGIGFLPYDRGVIILKSDLYISRNVMLLPRGMIGLGTDSFEYGLSIGAAVRF
jgi:hypothetical protein